MEVCILTIGHSPCPGSCQLQRSSEVAIPTHRLPARLQLAHVRSPRGEALRGHSLAEP